MRSLWFMPVTFVAGQHGFALFAPYLAVFLALAHFAKLRKRRVAVIASVPVVLPALSS